jgi:CheY-like chemotaxis protein
MAEGGRRRRSAPLVATAPKNGSHSNPVVGGVLVVDDEPGVREMLRLSLSLEGWTVEEATSGEDAIEHWKASTPDVVLLDQHLKGMTGLECAAELRLLSADARIILFSGYLDADASKEARRLRLLPLPKTDQRRLFDLLGVLADQMRTATARVG